MGAGGGAYRTRREVGFCRPIAITSECSTRHQLSVAVKDSVKEVIQQAARSFDAELHTQTYATTHADSDQLNHLLTFLPSRDDQVILDLATGAGYVAMEIAKRNPGWRIVGLDIASGAIKKNIELAKQQGLVNVDYQVFDGVTLPFEENFFSTVFCRYALHHFPLPHTTLAEVGRVLDKSGKFIVADAVRCRNDASDFINKFQVLKNDGHVRMYATDELTKMFTQHGLMLERSFESSLSFDRASNQEYAELIADTSDEIKKAYHLSIVDGRIRLTLPIFNAVFGKHTAP